MKIWIDKKTTTVWILKGYLLGFQHGVITAIGIQICSTNIE